MSEKIIAKIQREANKLAAQGFPFHAELLRTGIETGTVTSTIERVATMFERGKQFGEAKRVRNLVA